MFASDSCVYCTTRYNKCDRIGTKGLFFFTFIEERCVVIEENIDKNLQIELVTKYDTNDAEKEILVGGRPNPL